MNNDLRQHPNFKFLLKNRRPVSSKDPFVIIYSDGVRSMRYFSRAIFYAKRYDGAPAIDTQAGPIWITEEDFHETY